MGKCFRQIFRFSKFNEANYDYVSKLEGVTEAKALPIFRVMDL